MIDKFKIIKDIKLYKYYSPVIYKCNVCYEFFDSV